MQQLYYVIADGGGWRNVLNVDDIWKWAREEPKESTYWLILYNLYIIRLKMLMFWLSLLTTARELQLVLL